MKNILLLSKEVLRPETYLSCYGSKIYKTKNIDKLAEQGTRFDNYYTAAPSSAMSFTSMFSGLNPHQTKRATYKVEKKFDQCPTLSDELDKIGYEVHVIFGSKWYKNSYKKSRVFCDNTIFHPLENINEQIKSHYTSGVRIKPNNADPLKVIYDEVKEIFTQSKKENIFIWLHCPHVFLGRTGYASDIDMFDELLGMLFDFFNYDEIYLTADHGHQNCDKGIPVYGAHVYEGSVKIPLITPNHYNKKIVKDVVSSVQLKDIILNNKYEVNNFIYSDSQYYLQENRKLMIRKNDFKYIYNKRNKSEELYDIKYDPQENINLLLDSIYDRNRNKNYFLDEISFYPRWDEAKEMYELLLKEKNRIWKEGSFFQEFMFKLKKIYKMKLANLYRFTINSSYTHGRWGSRAQRSFYEK